LAEKKTNYLRGAALLAATVAITKVIGAIYKIPLYNLLGDEGTAHFQVTYTIYNLLLTLSTAGIPVALSRLIAAALATNRPLQVKRYFSVGLSAFVVIGGVCMAIMLLLPQQLADLMGDPDVAMGVRALAPAVLFACAISVYRGYAQGHANMMPTAISQIMEVSCKLVFGIAIAWLLSAAGHDKATISAGAIIGVTIGLALAVPILMFYKVRMDRKKSAPTGAPDVPMSRRATLAQIMKIGIPIMLGSSIMNIITLIDTKLVLLRLESGAGLLHDAAITLYGVYSKGLTMFALPSAFIVPVTVSVVPAISAALARRQGAEAREVMESSLKLTNLLAMPAAVGLSVLSAPVFQLLFPDSDPHGPSLLAVLAIASFFVCSQLITNAILQASGHERLALLSLPIGGVIKIAVNWFLVGTPTWNIMGAPVGTLACYVCITALNVLFILWKVPEPPNFLKISLRPAVCTACMGAAAWGVYGLAARFAGNLLHGRFGQLLILVGVIVLAVLIYAVLAILLRAVTREDMKLVPKGEKIAKILKIK